ncbi:hypothetical protein EI77_00276 [Prosthecobacter fusiformis]|uniref:Uncharacterized protein n=1 Tax=Prosthecobacter fusiformis TaxID=48464 RepID=A0A4R7SPX8_9BACT|nr:hypothetical protein [Prosthecobacter fusiformis]TDU80974.1 hypothetical protein EI77_00276 [Prosthecobacter fusiformis]
MAKSTTPKKAAAKKSAAVLSKKPVPQAKVGPVAKKALKPASKAAVKPTLERPSPAKKAAIKATSQAGIPLPAVSLPPPLELPPEPFIPASPPKTIPLTVNVQTSQGMAANGNNQPANLLVIVTCAGWPVTELDKNHFTLMEHFEVPGQEASFSNSITTFRNAGTGAYLIQTKPINGAPWRTGHHLGQLLVSNSEDQQGQAAFKIIIR